MLHEKEMHYQELVTYKEKKEYEEKVKSYDDVISEFSDLTNDEEFSEVVENKMSFANAEQLREKCFPDAIILKRFL